MKCFKTVLCVLSSYILLTTTHASKRPNIIVIVADDMGFNDVGFHGSNEIPTPNIDALAYNGVILNRHYTQALCTPSRSAFMTGKYPIHLGMQHLVILEPEPWGLSLNETLLPQRLKNHGYKTHAIGKWHLGFFRKEYTPTFRGFDSHYGYWQGLQDYYDHTVHATFSKEQGYDMRRNMEVDWEAQGKYSTNLFTEEAVRVIKEHDTSSPMFMYLAHLAPHTGNDNDPLQAPDEEIAKFSYIADPERRIYAAMVSMLDRSVGKVIAALREKHMLENSIVLFMSDNGAQTEGTHANHGSNYPFRGLKNSAWEGGTRGVAAVWSPLIKKPQRVSNHLMHISDWLPTLYSAAGLSHSELGEIDGKDAWKSISEDVESTRTDMIYNIDDVFGYAAVRQRDWKYTYGSTSKGAKDGWFGTPDNSNQTYDESAILFSQTASVLAGVVTYQQIHKKHILEKENLTIKNDFELLSEQKIKELRKAATVSCSSKVNPHPCNIMDGPCLFNLRDDPCESNNLISEFPHIAAELKAMISLMRLTAVAPRNVPRDPNADPARWNGTWTNWQDLEDVHKEKISPEILTLTPLTISLISAACVALLVIVIITTCKLKSSPKTQKFSITLFKSLEDHKDDASTKISTTRELEPLPYRV